MIKTNVSPSNYLIIKFQSEDEVLNSTLTGTEIIMVEGQGVYVVNKPGLISSTIKQLIADGTLILSSGAAPKTTRPAKPTAGERKPNKTKKDA